MNKQRWLFFILTFIKTIITGAVIGAVIACYKYATFYVIKYSNWLYQNDELYLRIIMVISAIILVFVSYVITRIDGNIQGGGLPQLELNIKNNTGRFKWYKSLPLMIINSLISFFIGLPLGSEAPSVFIGGSIADGTNKIFKQDDKKHVAIGEGVGFAAAFMSPLGGFCYAIEECLHHLNFDIAWRLIVCIISAFTVSYLINPSQILMFPVASNVDLEYAYLFLIIIVMNIALAFFMLWAVPKLKNFINKHHTFFLFKYRLFVVGFICIPLILFFPYLGGSGILVITNIFTLSSIQLVVGLLIIRLLLFVVVSNSTASGGMLVPTLAIGALLGELILSVASSFIEISQAEKALIILLSMLSLFAATNKTPLTAIVLSISIGGYKNFSYIIFPAIIVIGITSLPFMIMKIRELNDSLRELLRTGRYQIKKN